jgi:uncharacterized protein YndB with AHSA1/START domain
MLRSMGRTTPRHRCSVASSVTVSRRIDAPVDTVWALLADVHEWPGWSSLTNTCTRTHSDQPELAHPIRLGRHRLRVAVSPDTPFQLRSWLASAPTGALHPAVVTLSPTDDGRTELHWQVPPSRGIFGSARHRQQTLVRAVTELEAQLASTAEDPPTTRAEWAARHEPGGRAHLEGLQPDQAA